MKITKELLDKMDAEHDQLVQPREIDKDMRRLARLGLWAEEHGIPALKSYAGEVQMCGEDEAYIGDSADEALAALPKSTA